MNSVPVNKVPYLRTTRNFPEEPKQLTIEVNRAYVDTANAVNQRTIGIFSLNNPSITGESWYPQGAQRQQTLRQFYLINGAGSYPHGINTTLIPGFTKIYGTFEDETDGTWYPLPYVDTVAANNQVSLWVTAGSPGSPGNIVITGGGGADQPTISNGYVVLEWLSNT